MSRDDLLEQLAAVQRDEERLQATPRGETLSRPLDAEFRQRLARRLQTEVEASKADEDPPTAEPSDATADGDCGGQVVRGRFGRRAWLVPLAMAAGIGFLLVPGAQQAPLPDYQVEVGGQLRQQRSTTAPPRLAAPRFTTASTLSLVLRPSTAVEGPVEVRAVAVAEAGNPAANGAVELDFETRTSELGALSLQAAVSRLNLFPGSWTLVVAAGRPGDVPDLQALPSAVSNESLVVIRQAIEVLDDPRLDDARLDGETDDADGNG